MKRKVIYNPINISFIVKFIDKDSKITLFHGLVFFIIDFCNTLYHGLPNIMHNGLKILIDSAARIVVGLSRFSREITKLIHVELHQ